MIGIDGLSHLASHLAHSLRIIINLHLLVVFQYGMLLACLSNQVCHERLDSLYICRLDMDMSLVKSTSGIQIVRQVTQSSRSFYYIRYSLSQLFCPVRLALVVRKQLIKSTAICHLLYSVLHIINIDGIVCTSLLHILASMNHGMLHGLCSSFLAHVRAGHFCQVLHHSLLQGISLRIGLCWVNLTLIQVQVGIVLLVQFVSGQPVFVLLSSLVLLLLLKREHIRHRVLLVGHGIVPLLPFLVTREKRLVRLAFLAFRLNRHFVTLQMMAVTPFLVKAFPFLLALGILVEVVEHRWLWVVLVLSGFLPSLPFHHSLHVLDGTLPLLLSRLALTSTITQRILDFSIASLLHHGFLLLLRHFVPNVKSLASLHQVISQILVIKKSRHTNTQFLKHLDKIMLNLSPQSKVLSSLRTLLGKIGDELLRSHIHAVVVLPVRIIFVGKVNYLASNILTYRAINEVGKLSHLVFAT